MKQVSKPDAGYEEHRKISRKYVGPGCSPSPSSVKKYLPVMLADDYANDQIEFTAVKILLFVLVAILFKCK